MKEIRIPATLEQMDAVNEFIDSVLCDRECSPKNRMQIDLAVEEIFVNIASYSYTPGEGDAVVRCTVSEEPLQIEIVFEDTGKPYDPLAREDPDVTLSAQEREIGGLGIFLVKKLMDDVRYEYKEGTNILTIRKNL